MTQRLRPPGTDQHCVPALLFIRALNHKNSRSFQGGCVGHRNPSVGLCPVSCLHVLSQGGLRNNLEYLQDETKIETEKKLCFSSSKDYGRVWHSEHAPTCHFVRVGGQGTCSKMFCQRAKSQRNKCPVGWCMVVWWVDCKLQLQSLGWRSSKFRPMMAVDDLGARRHHKFGGKKLDSKDPRSATWSWAFCDCWDVHTEVCFKILQMCITWVQDVLAAKSLSSGLIKRKLDVGDVNQQEMCLKICNPCWPSEWTVPSALIKKAIQFLNH